jgi:hypothetical protein
VPSARTCEKNSKDLLFFLPEPRSPKTSAPVHEFRKCCDCGKMGIGRLIQSNEYRARVSPRQQIRRCQPRPTALRSIPGKGRMRPLEGVKLQTSLW